MATTILRFLGASVVASGLLVQSANAQNTCGQAVAQLQQYVAGVNQFAYVEYYQNIPARCGGNPMCMQMWLQQLNGWYVNQAGMVNGWYAQIQANCSSSSSGRTRIGGRRGGQEAAPELDEDDVASLDVDDEDKTVRIRIPSNPSGYRR